ncbi:MAG: SRPBCC family protein [Devosia sp.]|nr:SRPBCC family protein [Devosia sp.]
MHEFLVERRIEAPPETLWRILVDPAALSGGAFGIVRVEGQIALGERLRLWSSAAPNRAFPLKVTQLQPNRLMVWAGGMPFGLFTGTRTFRLAPAASGTQFSMREVYTGAMVGLIWPSMPDLGPSFQQFADALAAAAEARS